MSRSTAAGWLGPLTGLAIREARVAGAQHGYQHLMLTLADGRHLLVCNPREHSPVGAAPGEKNARANVTGVTDTISTRCATSLAGCYPANVITVKETGSVSTPFLGLFDLARPRPFAPAPAPVHVQPNPLLGNCGSPPP